MIELRKTFLGTIEIRKAILTLILACMTMAGQAQEGIGTGTVSTYGTKFLANYVNRTNGMQTFDYGVGILTAEGYLVPLAHRTANSMAPNASTGSVPFDLTTPLKERTGIHRLVPIARLGEAAPWFITIAPKESYVEAKVEYGTVSLSNKRNQEVAYSLLVPTVHFATTPTADQPTTITVNVQNMGNTAFTGTLHLSATYAGHIHQQVLTIAAGANHSFSVTYIPTTGGQSTFTLSLDTEGKKVVHSHTVDVIGENRQVSATYWTADTKHPQTIHTVGKLNIPADVLAVYTDMPDAITPDDSQPNRLYFFPEDALLPTTFDNYNTVVGSRADRIVLTDGHPFATPKSFTATSIVYRRTVGLTADGQGSGWETIVLPFDAAQIRDITSNSTLLWHKTEGDNGNFWLHRLDKVESDACHSVPVTGSMESYTPYLIAFPGTSFGTGSLAGHTLEWSTYEAEIYPDISLNDRVGDHALSGSFANTPLPDSAYVLNADRTAFEKKANAMATPFRAVLVSTASATATRFSVANGPQATGIGSLDYKPQSPSSPRYGLDGRRVLGAAKGIVIVDGKKVISNSR